MANNAFGKYLYFLIGAHPSIFLKTKNLLTVGSVYVNLR